jgi:broad specificity phosphatase PhoE
MAKLYMLQTGQTTWEQQDRVESVAGAPLSEQGVEEVRAAAADLAGRDVATIYASSGEAERRTARLLAKALGAKVRTNDALREIDYGLWQGLTVGQVKRRFPKIYRQWLEAPASVRPPEGESLEEVTGRLQTALREILKRHRDTAAPLLVLRPVAMALLRCAVESHPVEELWEHVAAGGSWNECRTDGRKN